MCSRSTHIWGVEEILCAKTCPFSVIFYCALCQSKIQNGTCKNLASIAGVRKDLCNRCGYRGLILAGGDNLEPRMRKPCAATISIFRVLSLHMFLQLFVLALNRFEAICQGRIDIGLTSQYHLQIVLCPLELILILLSSLFVCRNTFPVGWHPHQPK